MGNVKKHPTFFFNNLLALEMENKHFQVMEMKYAYALSKSHLHLANYNMFAVIWKL